MRVLVSTVSTGRHGQSEKSHSRTESILLPVADRRGIDFRRNALQSEPPSGTCSWAETAGDTVRTLACDAGTSRGEL